MSQRSPDRPSPLNRRTFLRGAGAGVGGAMLSASAATAAPFSGLAGALGAGAGGARSHAVGATDVLRMARVWATDREEGAFLLANFDDTHRVFDDGSLEVLLWPGDLPRLAASGLRYDVTVEDVLARDERVLRAADAQSSNASDHPGAREAYRTLADFEEDLFALVARFPDQARTIVLPERTLEGRQVFGIEIADDVARVDGRPVWYMDGLHHAREWPSGECTLMFAFELLENPEDDERITALRAGTRTVLVPVVNPDGFSWSRDALVQTSDQTASLPFIIVGQEAYWRKNRRGLVDEAVVPGVDRNPSAYGVDVNRNYSARWGGGGASAEPVQQNHRGSAPFSEPESRNVAELLRERQPVALNSNHTYTGLVLRPWGHTGGDGRFTPDEDLLRDLGAFMCRDSGYRNIHSFDLYVTTGTTVDWGYAALGALAYTFELGFSNFHPPYDGPDGALNSYAKNREAFIALGETALHRTVEHEVWDIETRDGTGRTAVYGTHAVIAGQVVDGDGDPLPCELTVSRTTRIPLGDGADAEFYEEPSSAVAATDEQGAIAWHLPPSSTPSAKERDEPEAWTLTITSASGETRTREVVVDRGEVANLGRVVIGEPTGGKGGGGHGNGRGRPEQPGRPPEVGRPEQPGRPQQSGRRDALGGVL